MTETAVKSCQDFSRDGLVVTNQNNEVDPIDDAKNRIVSAAMMADVAFRMRSEPDLIQALRLVCDAVAAFEQCCETHSINEASRQVA